MYGSLIQWSCLRLEIGIVDSLLRQWNGVLKSLISWIFETFWLKFAIVFKIGEQFRPLLLFNSCTAVTWQKFKNKKCFWSVSIPRIVETFLLKFALSVFFLHDLVTTGARKLEAVESNLIVEKTLALYLCVCVCVLAGVSFLVTPLFRAP